MRNQPWVYYDVHGILRAKSNVPTLNDFFRVPRLEGEPDLTIFIGDFRPREPEEDGLRIVYRARGLLRSEVLIEGLASGRARVLISNPYFRLFKKLSRRVRRLVRAIYYLMLLMKGHALLHSAGVERDGEGTLLIAPPETGKTFTAIKLVQDHGFKLLGDDMVIIGPGLRALASPGTMTLHPIHVRAHKIKLGPKRELEMAWRHALRGLPYVMMFVKEFKMRVDEVLGPGKVSREARVTRLLFLEEGRETLRPVGPEEAFRRLMAVGRMHHYVYENKVIQEYAYRNPELDLEGLFERLRSLCRSLVEGADCWLIRCHGKRFADLMLREGLL